MWILRVLICFLFLVQFFVEVFEGNTHMCCFDKTFLLVPFESEGSRHV